MSPPVDRMYSQDVSEGKYSLLTNGPGVTMWKEDLHVRHCRETNDLDNKGLDQRLYVKRATVLLLPTVGIYQYRWWLVNYYWASWPEDEVTLVKDDLVLSGSPWLLRGKEKRKKNTV